MFRWKLQTKEDGSRDILGEAEGENEEDDDGEDGEEEEVDDGEGGEDSKAVSSERNGDIVLRENPDLSRNYKSQYLKSIFYRFDIWSKLYYRMSHRKFKILFKNITLIVNIVLKNVLYNFL